MSVSYETEKARYYCVHRADPCNKVSPNGSVPAARGGEFTGLGWRIEPASSGEFAGPCKNEKASRTSGLVWPGHWRFHAVGSSVKVSPLSGRGSDKSDVCPMRMAVAVRAINCSPAMPAMVTSTLCPGSAVAT